METPNPKCSNCKCYWKPDETDIKPSGLYFKTCKKCREKNKKWIQENTEYKKKYREENADKIKEKNKKYREENADKIKEQEKKYREENKCSHHKFKRECKICNLQLYLINLQRKSINRCLKSSNLEKTKPSIEYLACSPEYFIEYFKKKMDIFNQFSEIEMDFTNIHIDHIKPVNAFNLDEEEEFLDCCNYTNLQPLLAKDNLSKKDKWSEKDDLFWNENIKDKEYYDIYLPV